MGTYIECEYYDSENNEITELDLLRIGHQSYAVFGFMANIRNLSQSPFISERRGLPEFINWQGYESHYHNGDDFGHSYLTLAELEAFDYSIEFIDQREDDKPTVTLRDFLGEGFFADLNTLKENEVKTIVFWFN